MTKFYLKKKKKKKTKKKKTKKFFFLQDLPKFLKRNIAFKTTRNKTFCRTTNMRMLACGKQWIVNIYSYISTNTKWFYVNIDTRGQWPQGLKKYNDEIDNKYDVNSHLYPPPFYLYIFYQIKVTKRDEQLCKCEMIWEIFVL